MVKASDFGSRGRMFESHLLHSFFYNISTFSDGRCFFECTRRFISISSQGFAQTPHKLYIFGNGRSRRICGYIIWKFEQACQPKTYTRSSKNRTFRFLSALSAIKPIFAGCKVNWGRGIRIWGPTLASTTRSSKNRTSPVLDGKMDFCRFWGKWRAANPNLMLHLVWHQHQTF